MIKIYDKNETDFKHNGICILDSCISCIVEEELNGMYKLELEYPIDYKNKWRNIQEGNIVKVPTPQGEQLFRLFKKNGENMNSVSYIGLHIFYDLLDNFIEDARPTNKTGALAIEEVFNGTQYLHKFSVSSDIAKVNTAYYIRKNPVEALLSDDENSFLNRWGGEIVRDNFNVSMKEHRGEDRGVTIRYGKNLINFKEEIDESNVITRIMPTGLYENDSVLMLPEKYIDSPLIGKYTYPKIRHMHFGEFKVNNSDDPKEKVTKNDVIRMLREKVKELYEVQKVDIPIVNYKVDFIELSKTEEYKNYRILERVWLGDIVTIKHERLDINLKSKVIKYKYDCISERYMEIELGNFVKNIVNSMNEQDKNLNILNNKIDSNVSNLKNVLSETAKIMEENKGSLDKAIEDATKTLNSALGGHVVKKNDELLIMDTTDINTATKVWRWNLNGLGYSSTGYNGKYETAITMDGKLNANFIQAGRIRGIALEGVEIASLDNPNWQAEDWEDFFSTSKNICKMVKGGLEFHSRQDFANAFNENLKVEIDGWGIRTRKDNEEVFAPKGYGQGELVLSGTYISSRPTDEAPNGGGIDLNSDKGIRLNLPEIWIHDGTKIKLDSFYNDGSLLGEVKDVSNGYGIISSVYNHTASKWDELILQNGWSAYDSNGYGVPSWCIDSTGFLHLKGMVRNGGKNTIIAKLPYVPECRNQIFTTVSGGNVLCRIDIDGYGNIRFNCGNNGFVSLAPITFRVKGW